MWGRVLIVWHLPKGQLYQHYGGQIQRSTVDRYSHISMCISATLSQSETSRSGGWKRRTFSLVML
ncbi:hypothetical protein RSAG8_12368, partial [Rhizoctonia solani AG-8 WAC10335]